MSDVSKTNDLIAEARRWRDSQLPASPWGDGHIVNRLADALESATRVLEQGEVSAAIERVRLYCENQGDKFRFHAGVILAALDGAPEPEWEVQYGRRNRETGALHWLTGDPRDDWWHENQDSYEHVKRYTSPPLPVKGEKP